MVCQRGLAVLVLVLITGFVDCSTYSVALLGMELQMDNTSDNSYELFMINQDDVEMQVDVMNIDSTLATESIPARGYVSVILEAQYGMNDTEYANKSLLIQSSGNFTLQVFSRTPSHTEGLLAIPIEDLNGPKLDEVVYEYIISTFCGTSGYCQMGVAALEDTEVRLTFPAHVHEISFCKGLDGWEIFRSNIESILLIKKYHAVQIETTRDLTGTHVYSFQPIVVFIGSRNVSMSNGLVHMIEQLAPSSQWGTKYAISTLGSNDFGDILKISASWPNTEVNMTGYQNFIISKKEDVVSRRLEKDSTTYITASAPIQVVQITGIDYATNDNSAKLAMVSVPAIEHYSETIKISCGTQQQSANFFVTSEKTKFPMIMGMHMSDITGIPFTPYKISKKEVTDNPVYELYGVLMGGVVKCDNGAVLPLKVTYDVSDDDSQNDTTDELPPAETTCLDGNYGWVTYGTSGYPATSTCFYQPFDGFSILKLRLITCGDVHVRINTNNGFVDYKISMKNVHVTRCIGQGCDGFDIIDDSFNINRQCSTDMAWYWFRVFHVSSDTKFCFGFGPVVSTDDRCSVIGQGNADVYEYPTHLDVSDFVITPLFTRSYFNYDLETDVDCQVRISDWRCEDRVRNCSTYGQDFCTDRNYQQLATNICPKFCKKCIADSYGRKFAFPFTHDAYVYIYVTLNASESRVGVTNTRNVIKQRHTNGRTLKYETTVMSHDVIWIVSENDVAVTVAYETDETYKAFNVFPVDSFSTEYLLLPDCSTEDCMCTIITEGVTASVTAYPNEPENFSEMDGDAFNVDSNEPFEISETNSGGISKGVKLVAYQPIGVFCGGQNTAENFEQIVPSAVYGTFFRIPPLRFNHTSLTKTQLVLKAVHPNTEVNLAGTGDDLYILETVGKLVEVDLNTDVSYTIQSNEPIKVGLQFLTNGLPRCISVPPTSCYISHALLFPAFHEQSQVNYITTAGMTSFINEVLEDLLSEPTLGVLMRSLDDHAVFLPSYFKLVPFESQKALCTTTTSSSRDGIDNDCDGHIDEDVCSTLYGVYGVDGDVDGDFHGDCGDVITEPIIVPELPPLVCQYIEQKFNHCWVAAKCPCSWVINLQDSSQQTESEFRAAQLVKSKKLEENLTIATDNLTAVKSQKLSAEDDRVSAASVGYVGITLFVLVFGTIFILDLTSLYRDLKILGGNLRIGLNRLNKWRIDKKARDGSFETESIEMDENMAP